MVTHTASIAVLIPRMLGSHRSHDPLDLGSRRLCLMLVRSGSGHLVGSAGERLRELGRGHLGDLGDKS